MIPPASVEAYAAAQQGCAMADRVDRGWVVVSGADRRTYLHGLLTNDIAGLTPGTGCYSAYLTPQGRMITDLWVYELGDVVLLSVPAEVKDTLIARLDQFIFTEDVQLGDVSSTFGAIAVVGPESAAVIASHFGLASDALSALWMEGKTISTNANFRTTFQDRPAIVLRTWDLGIDGFDVLVEADQAAALKEALRRAGVVSLDAASLAALRLEAGIPKFHADMDEEIIPLEAGIEDRAISMTKGCYVGQEVIVRVLHRGHGRVAKRLVGLVVDDAASPAVGAKVRTSDRDIGSVTSVAWSPALDRFVALGYVHRDFVAPGTRVTIGDGADQGSPLHAEVSSLPFVPTSL